MLVRVILSWAGSGVIRRYNTVNTRFTDTRQFALSLWKESPYIFSKFNPLNTDTFYGALSVRITLAPEIRSKNT